MKLFKTNLLIKPQHWIRALQELLYSLVLGLMPLWVGFILIRIFAPGTPTGELIDHGQLLVFSAAILAVGFYGVGQEFRDVNFPARPWILLILVIMVAFTAAVFSIVTFKTLIGIDASDVELSSIRICSGVVLAIAIISVYFITVINNAQTFREFAADDMRGQHGEELDDLGKKFDELGGQ